MIVYVCLNVSSCVRLYKTEHTCMIVSHCVCVRKYAYVNVCV